MSEKDKKYKFNEAGLPISELEAKTQGCIDQLLILLKEVEKNVIGLSDCLDQEEGGGGIQMTSSQKYQVKEILNNYTENNHFFRLLDQCYKEQRKDDDPLDDWQIEAWKNVETELLRLN